MLLPQHIFLKRQVPFAAVVTFLFGVFTLLILIFGVTSSSKPQLVQPMEIRTVMVRRPPPPPPPEKETETTTKKTTTEAAKTPEKIEFNSNRTVSTRRRLQPATQVTMDAGGGSAGAQRSLDISAAASLASKDAGSKLLSGEAALATGPVGRSGGRRTGTGLRGNSGMLGSGDGTGNSLGPGAGPGSGLGGPQGRGRDDSGTAQELQLQPIPAEQYARGVDTAGVCDWMSKNPGSLDSGVRQEMPGGKTAERFVAGKTQFKLAGRGIVEVQVMCDLAVDEVHIVLIEGTKASYMAVRTVGKAGNLFKSGVAKRRTQNAPIISLELQRMANAGSEARAFETLFYSWWNSVAP